MAEHCSETRQILLLLDRVSQNRRLLLLALARFQGRLQVLFGLPAILLDRTLDLICFNSVVLRLQINFHSLRHKTVTSSAAPVQQQSLIVLLS